MVAEKAQEPDSFWFKQKVTPFRDVRNLQLAQIHRIDAQDPNKLIRTALGFAQEVKRYRISVQDQLDQLYDLSSLKVIHELLEAGSSAYMVQPWIEESQRKCCLIRHVPSVHLDKEEKQNRCEICHFEFCSKHCVRTDLIPFGTEGEFVTMCVDCSLLGSVAFTWDFKDLNPAPEMKDGVPIPQEKMTEEQLNREMALGGEEFKKTMRIVKKIKINACGICPTIASQKKTL